MASRRTPHDTSAKGAPKTKVAPNKSMKRKTGVAVKRKTGTATGR